ncbi:recombinase family protein [Sphaerisporangium perillae]|uniref:recombinase family protein n=1 Tax=Sphaerisporangium perillae TaxID=2935860 RepID=UPI0020109B86|nr:recombinase family protein [Sphaerisporangium perillae]
MRAASYSRRSDARGKRSDQRSVEEQDNLNLQVAQRNDWDLPPNRMYRDNDISASRYSSKERADWTRLHNTLVNGEIDVLILYETSRAWRKVYEWVPLVELCAENKVLIHVTSDRRTYDPNDDRDWETLLEDGIDSEKESRKISKRVRRAMDANKEQGKPHATPAYGYEIQIDPADHRTKIRVPVPEQAAIVKEVIRRVAQSDPITAIARDLNERGIPSPSVALGLNTEKRSKGKTPLWSPAMIRKMCKNVAYIGKREYVEDGRTIFADGTWEPIVDEELFWKARNLLSDPTRKTTKPGRNKYLLGFLGTCDVCGSYLARMGGRDPYRYRCNADKSCVTIRMDWTDMFIGELVCQRLAKKDIYELLTRQDDADKARVVELEALRADHTTALDLRAKGKLSLLALSQEEERLLPRIAELEQALRPVTIPKALEDLTRDAQGNLQTIRARWAALAIPAKRDVLRTLFKSISIKKTKTPGQHKTGEQVERMLIERVAFEWLNES